MLKLEKAPNFRIKRPYVQIDYNDQTVIVKPSLFDMETYIQITKHYQALRGLINRAEEIDPIIEDDDLEMEMLTSLLYYEQLWANEAMILLNVNPNEMIINQIEK